MFVFFFPLHVSLCSFHGLFFFVAATHAQPRYRMRSDVVVRNPNGQTNSSSLVLITSYDHSLIGCEVFGNCSATRLFDYTASELQRRVCSSFLLLLLFFHLTLRRHLLFLYRATTMSSSACHPSTFGRRSRWQWCLRPSSMSLPSFRRPSSWHPRCLVPSSCDDVEATFFVSE